MPTEQERGDGLERRPPAGTAARRAAKPRNANRARTRGRLGTPTSGRHSGPQGRESRNANRTRARGRLGAPASGRHRCPQGRESRNANRTRARGRLGTPASGRHRGPQGRESRNANRTRARERLGTPASGRHRGPQGRKTAYHEPRRRPPRYQMSPTVNPSGKGSDGSTEYWAIPVIQAVPLIVGTTAGTPPTVVVRIRRPTNSVPTGPK